MRQVMRTVLVAALFYRTAKVTMLQRSGLPEDRLLRQSGERATNRESLATHLGLPYAGHYESRWRN